MLRKFLTAILAFGASQQHVGVSLAAQSIDSPEAALLSLENAYRSKDIEAAVASKDFVTEARLMLSKLAGNLTEDEEIVLSTAETLELSFRADIQENGFPDFSDLQCSVVAKHVRQQDVLALEEVCKNPSGAFVTRQIMLVKKNKDGWRVVGVDDSAE